MFYSFFYFPTIFLRYSARTTHSQAVIFHRFHNPPPGEKKNPQNNTQTHKTACDLRRFAFRAVAVPVVPVDGVVVVSPPR